MAIFPVRQWTKRQTIKPSTQEREFVVSTDPALIPVAAVNDAFGQDYIYWAKRLPEEGMRRMLDTSLCFGLYALEDNNNNTNNTASNLSSHSGSGPTKKLIGLARLVTDAVTFAYLTDVYVLPEYQGSGLGTWMLQCMDEMIGGWPHLRRLVLFTASPQSESYYQKLLGAETLSFAKGLWLMERKGPGKCV